jgi:hypothetical protein
MQTFDILVPLCIMSGFCPGDTNAQFPEKISNQSLIGIKPVSISNQDIIQANIMELYRLPGWIPARTGITIKSGFPFASSSNNNFNLINKQMLFNNNLANLPYK